MARIVTQAQLIQAVRDEADLNAGPTGFISDAMIGVWLNQGIAAVQGKLIDANEDHFLKTSGAIGINLGQTIYNLPWDAWKGRGIDVSTDPTFTNQVATARPFNWKQRNIYNSAMGVYSYLGATNMRYKFIPGTPLQIKFIPPNAPSNLNVQVWYLPEAPTLCGLTPTTQFPVAWASGSYATGSLATATVAGVPQVFYAAAGGTTGVSQPAWVVPGITTDSSVTWSYVGPLSLFVQTWDGFNGWEEGPILYACMKGLAKQQKDVSEKAGLYSNMLERISTETRNTDEDEPDYIVDTFYSDAGFMDGGLGGGGGFG